MLKNIVKYCINFLGKDGLYQTLQVFQTNFFYGISEKDKRSLEFIKTFIKKDSEVIDVGANFGYYTRFFAAFLNKKGQVFGFEPIPMAYRIASRVVKKHKNVVLHQKGVGKRKASVEFIIPVDNWKNKSYGLAHLNTQDIISEEMVERVAAKIITIDEFLLPKLTNLSFVKIDTEGSEFFVLEGMRETIDKFQPVIYLELVSSFLNRYQVTEQMVWSFIEDIGYTVFVYSEELDNLVPFKESTFRNNFFLLPKHY